jgi:hypothetical protein
MLLVRSATTRSTSECRRGELASSLGETRPRGPVSPKLAFCIFETRSVCRVFEAHHSPSFGSPPCQESSQIAHRNAKSPRLLHALDAHRALISRCIRKPGRAKFRLLSPKFARPLRRTKVTPLPRNDLRRRAKTAQGQKSPQSRERQYLRRKRCAPNSAPVCVVRIGTSELDKNRSPRSLHKTSEIPAIRATPSRFQRAADQLKWGRTICPTAERRANAVGPRRLLTGNLNFCSTCEARL